MFKFLKEKLQNWTKKFSEKSVEEETKKESKKKPEKKKEEKVKEIRLPEKFNVGTQKYEPDLEKLKEQADNIKKDVHFEPSLDKQLRGETIGEGLKQFETETQQDEKEQTHLKLEPKSLFERLKSKIIKIRISEEEFDVYAEDLQ